MFIRMALSSSFIAVATKLAALALASRLAAIAARASSIIRLISTLYAPARTGSIGCFGYLAHDIYGHSNP